MGLRSKTRANAVLVGHSPPLVPWRVRGRSQLASWSAPLSSSSLIATSQATAARAAAWPLPSLSSHSRQWPLNPATHTRALVAPACVLWRDFGGLRQLGDRRCRDSGQGSGPMRFLLGILLHWCRGGLVADRSWPVGQRL